MEGVTHQEEGSTAGPTNRMTNTTTPNVAAMNGMEVTNSATTTTTNTTDNGVNIGDKANGTLGTSNISNGTSVSDSGNIESSTGQPQNKRRRVEEEVVQVDAIVPNNQEEVVVQDAIVPTNPTCDNKNCLVCCNYLSLGHLRTVENLNPMQRHKLFHLHDTGNIDYNGTPEDSNGSDDAVDKDNLCFAPCGVYILDRNAIDDVEIRDDVKDVLHFRYSCRNKNCSFSKPSYPFHLEEKEILETIWCPLCWEEIIEDPRVSDRSLTDAQRHNLIKRATMKHISNSTKHRKNNDKSTMVNTIADGQPSDMVDGKKVFKMWNMNSYTVLQVALDYARSQIGLTSFYNKTGLDDDNVTYSNLEPVFIEQLFSNVMLRMGVAREYLKNFEWDKNKKQAKLLTVEDGYDISLVSREKNEYSKYCKVHHKKNVGKAKNGFVKLQAIKILEHMINIWLNLQIRFNTALKGKSYKAGYEAGLKAAVALKKKAYKAGYEAGLKAAAAAASAAASSSSPDARSTVAGNGTNRSPNAGATVGTDGVVAGDTTDGDGPNAGDSGTSCSCKIDFDTPYKTIHETIELLFCHESYVKRFLNEPKKLFSFFFEPFGYGYDNIDDDDDKAIDQLNIHIDGIAEVASDEGLFQNKIGAIHRPEGQKKDNKTSKRRRRRSTKTLRQPAGQQEVENTSNSRNTSSTGTQESAANSRAGQQETGTNSAADQQEGPTTSPAEQQVVETNSTTGPQETAPNPVG